MKRTVLAGAALAAAGLLTAAGTAAADTPAGVADIGNANFTKAGTTISVPTQSACAVEGPTSASSPAVAKPGVTFGGGTSSCTTQVTDPANDVTTTTSTATGNNFELSALVSSGGKRIRISTYTVTCKATQSGTNANWTLSGLTGITGLPSPIPANYTKPLTKSDGTLLANAVFNIQTLPGDGSMTLTMLRIDFAPASGATGSVTIGHTACSPTP
ncbi:hypothetical protein CU254_01420 [Amycolatopsis sp. AA4]|uniref:hypothetical protein n=1 Tax=Amycolatopsis sp. AA4 TaxID=1896961 RepID=UPI000C227215|nr:hypothetical protein [Amycolatopsis sp. AA4]ATY16079.1 hypothetical protein CU254_01420 [Amycolatopsis sp. AA4]